MCRFTAISENSRQKNLKPMEYPRSILSAEDSRAKMLAQQVKELVSLIVKGTLPAPVFEESMPGLIRELKPRWIVAENVRGLLSISAAGIRGGGFGTVLRDLAEMGYRVGWSCYGAADVGAPHKRERVFIVGYRECMW